MTVSRILSLFVGYHGILSTHNSQEDGILRFVTFGDSGAVGDAQSMTGSILSSIVSTRSTAFVAMVGDNFYPCGIRSVIDPIVQSAFSDVFAGIAIPFHPVLGDNDYGDAGIVGNISAQVDLSRSISNWMMPSFFFSKIESTPLVRICTIYLDTQSLISIPDVDARTPEELGVLETQMDWLETTLASPDCQSSNFIVVFGHHTIKSTGKKHMKGKSAPLIEKLTPLFDKYKIDAYFSGHDHDLQAISPISCSSPDGNETVAVSHCVSYIVSGASSRLRKSPKEVPIPGHDTWAVRDVIGLTLTEAISPDEMVTSFISSATGETVHTHRIRSHLALREIR
jgi:tartrate-resistant acid phosphatase type 5